SRQRGRGGVLGHQRRLLQDARLWDQRLLRRGRRLALRARLELFVSPSTFGFDKSLLLVVGAVVGGLGSLAGMALGALFIQFVPTWAANLSSAPGAPSVFFGTAIVLVMILLPGGLGAFLLKLTEPLTRRLYTRSE